MARRTSKKATSKKRTSSKTKKQTRQPVVLEISPQRRMDIFGIILVVIGLLTLISLFTQSTGSVTGWWVANLSKAIGWGTYLLPLALIGLGGGMLLRNVEKFPALSTERAVGIVLFLLNLPVWFHMVIDGDFTDAQLGTGGGYLGAGLKILLVQLLGKPGAIIALVAWLLISLILMLDLTMANAVKWVEDQIQKTADKMKANAKAKRARRAGSSSPTVSTQTANPPQTLRSHEKPVGRPSQQQPTAAPQGDVTSLYVKDDPLKQEWVLPILDEILEPGVEVVDDGENDRQRANVIEETLRSFGAPVHIVEIRKGPAITLFGVEPDFVESRNGKTRVRVSKITALADDLALALAASRIRIQAPVPGKGYIGIEVPNRQISLVALRDVIASPAFQKLDSPLKLGLGKDVAGNVVAADLTSMPHLLIAGTTGAGK
jgi:S-DNA-T family DNA segregation ATPase FtsK/SpoIIIE